MKIEGHGCLNWLSLTHDVNGLIFMCHEMRCLSHSDLRRSVSIRNSGPVPFAVLAIALLLASCTPPASHGVATYKKALVHDAPLSDAISAGDKAVSAKDLSGAMREYQKASNDRDTKVRASAYNRIGELYESGLGVAQDYAQSVSWFKKAALLGNAYGEANLGNCLFFGLGTNRDREEAERWAEKGADGGVAMSINQLGWQYLHGVGVAQDAALARHWYEKSAFLGDSTGQLMLGWIYVHIAPVDYAQGMSWYRKAADQNDEGAQSNIGFLYENGLGVPKDYTEAARWYQLSADAGYSRALFHLGYLYDGGLGVKMDKTLARALMQKSADSGDEEATRWLSSH